VGPEAYEDAQHAEELVVRVLEARNPALLHRFPDRRISPRDRHVGEKGLVEVKSSGFTVLGADPRPLERRFERRSVRSEETPLELDTPNGLWRPVNFDGEFRGKLSRLGPAVLVPSVPCVDQNAPYRNPKTLLECLVRSV
jgi:hypothetical protein